MGNASSHSGRTVRRPPSDLESGSTDAVPRVLEAPPSRPRAHGGIRNLQAPKMQPTCTIRSMINLKRQTLRAFPDPANEGHYKVEFLFDSLQPCRLSVYYMATEKKAEPIAILKSNYKKPIVEVVQANSGYNQLFTSGPGGLLPLKFSEVEKVTATGGPCYPLVIQIETLPDLNGFKENTGLSMQAQTTYATFVKQSDGTFEVQVLKQHLWLDSTAYALHEIFGIDKAGEVKAGGEGQKECVICLADTRDTLALPCRHLCMCCDCAKALRHQSNKCPICRTVVESLLQIKTTLAPEAEAMAALAANVRRAEEAADADSSSVRDGGAPPPTTIHEAPSDQAPNTATTTATEGVGATGSSSFRLDRHPSQGVLETGGAVLTALGLCAPGGGARREGKDEHAVL